MRSLWQRVHRLLPLPLLLLVPGCIIPYVGSEESGFTVSPDGRWIASVKQSHAGLAVPPGGEICGQGSCAVRIRDEQGRLQHQWTYRRFGDGRMQGVHDIAWSPDSTRLAVKGSRGLEVLKFADQQWTLLVDRVAGFRWADASNIVVATGRISLKRVSADGEQLQPIFAQRCTDLAAESCWISPDCATAVYQDRDHLRAVELTDTNVLHDAIVEGTAHRCQWDSAGERCLIPMLISRRTDTDYYARPNVRTLLYERATGRFADLSARLPVLPAGEEFDAPWAFSPNGSWLLLSSSADWNTREFAVRWWLVRLSPWSVVCLNDSLPPTCQPNAFMPRGDYLLLSQPTRRNTGRHDLFVARLAAAPDGGVVVGAPVQVAEDQSNWFWHNDGNRLVVTDGWKFKTVPVNPH